MKFYFLFVALLFLSYLFNGNVADSGEQNVTIKNSLETNANHTKMTRVAATQGSPVVTSSPTNSSRLNESTVAHVPPTEAPTTALKVQNISVSMKASSVAQIENADKTPLPKNSEEDEVASKHDENEEEATAVDNNETDAKPKPEEKQQKSAKPEKSENVDTNLQTGGRLLDDEPENSHFMRYFLILCVLVAVGYVAFYKRKKIMAFVIEGKRRQGSERKAVRYRKLRDGSSAADEDAGVPKGNVIY